MLYLVLKAAISGVIVAIVSEVARRYPGLGGLIASLPLTSILAMMWLWGDLHDPSRVAQQAASTFWFILPTLPMFLLIPEMLKRGLGFWPTLVSGCALTITLYAATVWLGPRLGLRL